MQISSTIGALCTINKLAVNLLGQDRKKCAKCVVLCQVSVQLWWRLADPSKHLLFSGAISLRHNQQRAFHQSNLRLRQPFRPPLCPSARLCREGRAAGTHCSSLVFHQFQPTGTQRREAAASSALVWVHWKIHTGLQWLDVFSRNVRFRCKIQDIAWCQWPFWLLGATSGCETSTRCPWAICEERCIQSLWLAVPPEQLRRQWANTGTKPRATLQGESGAPFLLLFSVTDHRAAIYFNDVNEQWCRVGLLERLLILPGGKMKHQGDLHNLQYVKDNVLLCLLLYQ